MLANMPATTSIGNNINPHPSMEHGQCIQYNFLKRKLNVEDTQHQQQQQEEINNSNGAYQGSNNIDGNSWKKRHTEALATSTPTTTKTSTCFDANSLDAAFISINSHKNNNINNNNNMLSHNNNNNNNNNNVVIHNNNNDLQFSLSSSAFINDLFSYDNNLIVPVSISAAIDTNATIAASSTIAAPSTGGNIATHYATNDNANWQSTDLLELDHRYNSTLQAVENSVAQHTPTATTTTATALTSPTIHQLNPTLPPQQHPQQAQQHFLIPQKQIARSQHMLTKYRQHYQQQHSQQQHPQQNQPQQSQQHNQQLQQEHFSIATSQQPQQSSDSESDFEDKNLSWLLNFKFDELPHLSPDIAGTTSQQNPNAASESVVPTTQQRGLKASANSPALCSSQNSSSSSERSRSKSPKTSSKASKKFEELVMEVTAECDGNDMIVGENVVIEDYSPKAQKKPPFTYTELIEYALEDKGELTVSGIYQWISDRFPFYKSNDDRWKNSVRHNLSINPHFRKGAKAPQGAGHLWTISSGDSAENVLAWEHKKQRLDLFFKMESMNRERIQEHQQKLQKQQQQQQHLQQHQLLSQHSHLEQQQCSTYSPLHQQCQPGQCLYDEAAAAAAAITQEMLQQTSTSSTSPNTSLSLTSSVESNVRELRHGFHELHNFNDLMSDEELRKTAGQILNGIHREVEVQSVNSIISTYHDVLLDTADLSKIDYLNPIHKDVAVNESGLRNTCHNHTTSQYYITEIDPIELGIQMSHQVEEEVLFSDEFNLNYFGYNAGNDIVA